MNTWCLIFCALVGALVATFVGYRFYDRRDRELTEELCALAISIALAAIACYNPPAWIPFTSESQLVRFAVICGFIGVTLLCYYVMKFCARCGEELTYAPAVRRMRRQTHNWSLVQVISVKQVRHALREARFQEYDQELERMLDLAEGLEWIDLEADEFLATEPESAIQSLPALQVAAKPIVLQPKLAATTLAELTKQLSLTDTQLIEELFRRQPELYYMLESTELYAQIEIVGVGEQKHVKVKGAIYAHRTAV